jgi:DNA-binding response OmpR family regulator
LVNGAADVDTAIETARWHRPHLLLVSLGGTPQRVLSESLRVRSQAGLGRQTPIVVLSITTVAEGSELHIEENLYVTLPDNLNQLRALLTRLLERTSTID